MSIPGSQGKIEPYLGLVDTGAESVLAASWLADLAGVDLSTNSDAAVVGIGGQVVEVVFAEVELRFGPARRRVERRCQRTVITTRRYHL